MSILDINIIQVSDTAERLNRVFDETADKIVYATNLLLKENPSIKDYWVEFICTPYDGSQPITTPEYPEIKTKINVPLDVDKIKAREAIETVWKGWFASQIVTDTIEFFEVIVDAIYP